MAERSQSQITWYSNLFLLPNPKALGGAKRRLMLLG